MPNCFNPFRNIEFMYDFGRGLRYLRKAKIKRKELEFIEELVSPHQIISKNGRHALLKAVMSLYAGTKPNNVAIYSC